MVIPPSSSSSSLSDNPVIQDVMRALQDEDLCDVELIGGDGIPVHANRFLLAARSPVFKSLFYGHFSESTKTSIEFPDFECASLRAIVEFCNRNEISQFRLRVTGTAASAHRLANLYQAADYFGLPILVNEISRICHSLLIRYPTLACAIYESAPVGTRIYQDALLLIQCRPYVALPSDQTTGGGIQALSAGYKLESIFQDEDIQAGESFLFEILQEWVQSQKSDSSSTDNDDTDADNVKEQHRRQVLEMAQTCAALMKFDYIEPELLLSKVKESQLCTEQTIMKAITQQALKASKENLWSLGSRGKSDVERILVEGAGSKNVNGIYFRIEGLANGELYSKREIACGQQFVYTLSCSLNEERNEMECRIFCSKLLTHRSVRHIIQDRKEQVNQPLLQVISIDENQDLLSNGGKAYTEVSLSDGDHFVRGRMSPRLRALHKRNNELGQNSLIKLIEYERKKSDDEIVTLELKRLVVISQDPGYIFGSPINYYDAFDEDISDDNNSSASSEEEAAIKSMVGSVIETEICISNQQEGARPSRSLDAQQSVSKLYSASYPLDLKPFDSKIPKVGWIIDEEGLAPAPTCRWIAGPPTKKQGKQ